MKNKRRSHYVEIDMEKLYDLYINERNTLDYLAKQVFFVSRQTLATRLREHNIKRDNGAKRPHYIPIDIDTLKELYYDKKYALYDLSRVFNCSIGTIIKRMEEYNLPRRTSWEWKER